jgi:hypothetical protein
LSWTDGYQAAIRHAKSRHDSIDIEQRIDTGLSLTWGVGCSSWCVPRGFDVASDLDWLGQQASVATNSRDRFRRGCSKPYRTWLTAIEGTVIRCSRQRRTPGLAACAKLLRLFRCESGVVQSAYGSRRQTTSQFGRVRRASDGKPPAYPFGSMLDVHILRCSLTSLFPLNVRKPPCCLIPFIMSASFEQSDCHNASTNTHPTHDRCSAQRRTGSIPCTTPRSIYTIETKAICGYFGAEITFLLRPDLDEL